MLNRTLTVLFILKKNKAQHNGTYPLYMRLTVEGKRAELTTKRFVDGDVWDSKAQKLIPRMIPGKKSIHSSEEIKSINEYLRTLDRQVYDAHRELLNAGKSPTVEMLKNKLTGVEEKQRMLLEVVQQHNNDIKTLIGKGYTRATWVKYNTTQKHITEFLKWKYAVSDINLKELNYEFVTDFEFYLKSEKSIDVNTNAKYIKNLKKIVHECVAKNWLDKDPFMAYKIKKKQTERQYLTEAEIQIIEEKEISMERLQHIRDLFLFSCYTGLSYTDVYNLTPNNVSLGIDGERWIFTHRQKTETASRIPLLPPALAILDKYSNDQRVVNSGKLLPVPSNQKVNAYLKEIATLCEIKKELTFHVARHTFATTITLTNGVPIESVSKMLGHKKMQTTQHYAKILDKRVSDDMKSLKEKFNQTPKSSMVKAN
jgi:site-specific recombinase XerD